VNKSTDLSGHSGRGHLVLICAECHRPRRLLKVSKLRRCPTADRTDGLG